MKPPWEAKRGLCAAVSIVLSLLLGSDAGAEDTTIPLLDAKADQTIGRAFVPSEERKVGEVRLILRGDTNVVQTLLYTKVLSRVVGEIRKKEIANWPAGRSGHADAVRYVDVLADVQKQIWERIPKDTQLDDRRQRMLIELVLSARGAVVMVGAFDMTESGGEVKVVRREPLATLELSRDYVRQNMRLIAADSFRVDEVALGPLLGPLELIREPAQAGANGSR